MGQVDRGGFVIGVLVTILQRLGISRAIPCTWLGGVRGDTGRRRMENEAEGNSDFLSEHGALGYLKAFQDGRLLALIMAKTTYSSYY